MRWWRRLIMGTLDAGGFEAASRRIADLGEFVIELWKYVLKWFDMHMAQMYTSRVSSKRNASQSNFLSLFTSLKLRPICLATISPTPTQTRITHSFGPCFPSPKKITCTVISSRAFLDSGG
jgi:hypothetical protein